MVSHFYDLLRSSWGSAFRSAGWLASSLGNRPSLRSHHALLLTSSNQRLDTPSAPRRGAFLRLAQVGVTPTDTASQGHDTRTCPTITRVGSRGSDGGSDPLSVKQRLPCARSTLLFVKVSATSPNDFSAYETRKPPPDATVLATLSRLTGRNPSRTVTPHGWFSYGDCAPALSLNAVYSRSDDLRSGRESNSQTETRLGHYVEST